MPSQQLSDEESIVPIYDGRGVDADFVEVLDRLNTLPALREELPTNSCAVVGYTINTFNKSGDPIKSVSFNVQWAVRLSD
jgi:hypothetical protein